MLPGQLKNLSEWPYWTVCVRKTVTGKTWLDIFIDALSNRDKYLVEYFSTKTAFKFGDGAEVTASRKVKLIAVIVSY